MGMSMAATILRSVLMRMELTGPTIPPRLFSTGTMPKSKRPSRTASKTSENSRQGMAAAVEVPFTGGDLAVGAVLALEADGLGLALLDCAGLGHDPLPKLDREIGAGEAARGALDALEDGLLPSGIGDGRLQGAGEEGLLHPLVDEREEPRVDPVDVVPKVLERHASSSVFERPRALGARR